MTLNLHFAKEKHFHFKRDHSRGIKHVYAARGCSEKCVFFKKVLGVILLGVKGFGGKGFWCKRRLV